MLSDHDGGPEEGPECAKMSPSKNTVITLQDPHRVTTLSIAAALPVPSTPAPVKPEEPVTPSKTPAKPATESTDAEKKVVVPAVAKAKTQPYNVSPYVSGYTGASLTSTSMDPMTKSDATMFD
ncbi:hypothetical protein FS749_009613 [Ceratobasidium sp. UAMH 11750]|nr:hypothetical protein FS749_009613 [Ceratobasidium sp. UAMH 11750]